VILADTGPLVAADDAGDNDHRAGADLLTKTPGPTAVAQACYLLERNAGPAIEVSFRRSFATGLSPWLTRCPLTSRTFKVGTSNHSPDDIRLMQA
jgi:hypothetical protein